MNSEPLSIYGGLQTGNIGSGFGPGSFKDVYGWGLPMNSVPGMGGMPWSGEDMIKSEMFKQSLPKYGYF